MLKSLMSWEILFFRSNNPNTGGIFFVAPQFSSTGFAVLCHTGKARECMHHTNEHEVLSHFFVNGDKNETSPLTHRPSQGAIFVSPSTRSCLLDVLLRFVQGRQLRVSLLPLTGELSIGIGSTLSLSALSGGARGAE